MWLGKLGKLATFVCWKRISENPKYVKYYSILLYTLQFITNFMMVMMNNTVSPTHLVWRRLANSKEYCLSYHCNIYLWSQLYILESSPIVFSKMMLFVSAFSIPDWLEFVTIQPIVYPFPTWSKTLL